MTRFRCPRELRLELAALVLLFTPLLACGLNLDLPVGENSPKKVPPPVEIDDDDKKAKAAAVPGKGTIDLGTAIYPSDAPNKGTILWSFSVPPMHRVGYRLSATEAKAVDDFYAAYAKSVKFQRTGDKSFQWVPPSGCPDDMSCVYKKLMVRSESDIGVLTDRFKARAKSAKLNSVQLAETMLSFVQEIPYKIPDDPFGLRPPPLVLTKKAGDCDSKALLFFMMLTQAGIDAVIVSSKAHAHTMVGVALPVAGSTFRYKDRKFAFAEVTAKNAPLGWLPPDVSSPNDWRVELAN